MPTFRQPEWQQPADRHTQIVDPVLTVRQLSRFEFSLKSYVRIDHALVFATAKGGYEAYLPPRRPTRGDIAANHYTAVYEVDMGVHPHTSDLTLPSDNDAFEFTAVVDLSWQVLDPARFVASGHRDVPGLLLGELQQAARPVTRRFAIADSAAAEVELLERMKLLGPLGAPAGLQVTWTLRLRRDQANIEHELRKQAIDHSADEQIRAAQRGMQIDVEFDRRDRQQDKLQIERALQYGTHQQELLLQQQRWQHAQALLAGQQQLELQQLEAEKINFYAWHLQQGGVHQWALHLAQHPEDSRLVMSSMREDQLRMIQAQMDLVQQLLSGDAAENWELEGPKQLALRTVNDILTQRLPGVPQVPPALAEGAGTGYPGAAAGPGPTAPAGSATPAPGEPPTAAPAQLNGGQALSGHPPTPGPYAAGETTPGGLLHNPTPGSYAPGQPPALGPYAPGQPPAPGPYAPGQPPAPGPYTPGQTPVPGPYAPGQTPTSGPYTLGQTPAPGPYTPGRPPTPGSHLGVPPGAPGTPGAPYPGAPGQTPAGHSTPPMGMPAHPTAPPAPPGPPGGTTLPPQGPFSGTPSPAPTIAPPPAHTPATATQPTAPPAASPPPSPPGTTLPPQGPFSGTPSPAPTIPPPPAHTPADPHPADPAHTPSSPTDSPHPAPPSPLPAPAPTPWQRPPGYGQTPTLPAQDVPETPAAAADQNGGEPVEAEGGTA
ncbi:hypothetical protein [Streptomyces sp. NPDC005760]|uniref:hypothetical protein n=1 Tax=Streptomyces sp. NPDC005760 TaxID=3156718 RepID=UPI0033D310BD